MVVFGDEPPFGGVAIDIGGDEIQTVAADDFAYFLNGATARCWVLVGFGVWIVTLYEGDGHFRT